VPGQRTDPRVTRTERALEQAIVELAAVQPVSRITVAALAERAGVTRATFYNRYDGPLDLLTRVLYADLERGHRREDELRAEGRHSGAELMRMATAEVADHVERFEDVYRNALQDPADRGVYDALVRHFTDYSVTFMARSGAAAPAHANQRIMASFVAHGFAGAIAAWLADDGVTKEDLVDAAVACAPAWWR
jgi:AcrR family transcriptional regulator